MSNVCTDKELLSPYLRSQSIFPTLKEASSFRLQMSSHEAACPIELPSMQVSKWLNISAIFAVLRAKG